MSLSLQLQNQEGENAFGVKCSYVYPTSPFTTLKLQNPSHDVSELHKVRRSTDFEALKLGKGSSGSFPD